MHFSAFLRDNVANICCMLLENQMKVFISKKILFCKSGMVVLKTWLLYWCMERGGKGCKLLYDKIQQNFQMVFFESTNEEVSFEWSYPVVCLQTLEPPYKTC